MHEVGRFEKDPDAVLDYRWDWTAWLDEGETIASHDVVVDQGTVVIEPSPAPSETDGNVTAWISGGDPFTNSIVRCRITTSAGRTDDRSIILTIKQR